MRISIKRTVIATVIASICCQAVAGADTQPLQSGGTQSKADDPCAKKTGQVAGAVIGALLGGLLGRQIGKGNGKTVATIVGAVGGLALGKYIGAEHDRRKCELSKIAKENGLEVVMADLPPLPNADDPNSANTARNNEPIGMSLAIEDRSSSVQTSEISGGEELGNAAASTQFRSGSAALSEQAEKYFRLIAAQYAYPHRADALPPNSTSEQVTALKALRQKRILILGHTDDTGSSRLNADLSEQRASNVAKLFAEVGFPSEQIFYQGSGETQPVADNRSAEGRAKNRRVEIVDVSNEAAFQQYLANRTTNAHFYRAVDPATKQVEAVPSEENRSPPAAIIAEVKPSKPAVKSKSKPRALAKVDTPPVAVAEPLAYDFGGDPLSSHPVSINIGKLVTKGSSFSLISNAIADDMPMARSCSEDRPRVSNPVKALLGGREYKAGDYLPNLYGTSWAERVNGNLIALTNVAVLRDGAAPVGRPTLMIFKASRGKLENDAKADFTASPAVNTYQGENALLYRVFVDGPIKCMDVVIPRDRPELAINSNLQYKRAGTPMVAAFNPRIAK